MSSNCAPEENSATRAKSMAEIALNTGPALIGRDQWLRSGYNVA
jgi:hypothetical protein